MSGFTEAAIAALASGQDLGTLEQPAGTASPADGAAEVPKEPVNAPEPEGGETTVSEASEGGLEALLKSVDSDDDPGEETEPEAGEGSPEPSVEVIKAAGKRLKVDYNDREATRRAHIKAAGMRKAHQDLNAANKRIQALETNLQSVEENLPLIRSLVEAQETGDTESVFKAVFGDDFSLQSVIQERMERERLREAATPEELAAMDLEEQLLTEKKERERLETKVKKDLEQAESARDAAEIRSLEAKVHPVFDKYRFAGKLGDPHAEQIMDEALWSRTMSKLDEYPEDADLTNDAIRKEFRSVYNSIQKVVNKQADRRVKAKTAKRKQAAAENAALHATRGPETPSLQREAAQKIRGGDIKGLLGNWGKYGKLFT